jgi:hypothetical protein
MVLNILSTNCARIDREKRPLEGKIGKERHPVLVNGARCVRGFGVKSDHLGR